MNLQERNHNFYLSALSILCGKFHFYDIILVIQYINENKKPESTNSSHLHNPPCHFNVHVELCLGNVYSKEVNRKRDCFA